MSRAKQPKMMTVALKRVLRRAQLWHASRLVVADDDAWRAAWPVIGRNIEARLAEEFGA